MIRYLKNTAGIFMRYRFLLMNLVQRDIKVKYRRSTLGLLWSVLNPLLMMSVMVLVFQNLFNSIMDPASLPPVASTGLPPSFPMYVLSGQLIFTFFSESTNMAMDSVYGNAGLIKKVYIPKYIFPMEKVMFGLINTCFSLIALVVVMVATRSPVSWWILLFPLPLLLLFFFNLGVGLILSSAVVFFRDIKHLYSVFILALTYMTPIFYPESMLGPNIALLIRFNPVYWYVAMFRQFVVYGRGPTDAQLVVTVGCAAVAMVIGLLVFRKSQDDFILHI